MIPRSPNDTERQTIVGPTGSGKTVFAAWELARRSINTKPWVILDYKIDPLLNEIDYANHVDMDFTPKKPGLYIYHPIPDPDTNGVEDLLWRLHERENIGLYLDEAYMLRSSRAYEALLTQGRSKHIPIISLCQRPARISLFTFSEAEYLQIFPLRMKKDIDRVQEFTDDQINCAAGLPPFYSYYYDVKRRVAMTFKPCPSPNTILEMFDAKLKPNTKWL